MHSSKSLAGYAVDFVSQDRMQVPRRSFDLDRKDGGIVVGFMAATSRPSAPMATARPLVTAVDERKSWTASRPSVIASAADSSLVGYYRSTNSRRACQVFWATRLRKT